MHLRGRPVLLELPQTRSFSISNNMAISVFSRSVSENAFIHTSNSLPSDSLNPLVSKKKRIQRTNTTDSSDSDSAGDDLTASGVNETDSEESFNVPVRSPRGGPRRISIVNSKSKPNVGCLIIHVIDTRLADSVCISTLVVLLFSWSMTHV